ncbi:MAG TPA: L-aspartate oxidase [Acetobacteraceae bacterium]|nr:L-aspartate oxidase [Acetobacteraceae bacterium]
MIPPDLIAGKPVIVGGGIAGLMAALTLAPAPVLLLSAAPLGEQAASGWAQGGIAAAVGPDDSLALHLADTLAAGDGLVDEAAVRAILAQGPAIIAALTERGARFDTDAAGNLALGLEAGHSRRRIVHAAGDATGREVLRALVERVRATPSIEIWEGAAATRLLVRDNRIAGLLVRRAEGLVRLAARRVILATGGVGGLFVHTTNPRGAIGQGLMLAARAGAALADLEFVQFHPTALDVGLDPMPLVSEAVRGEGAVLIDETGARFMAGQGRAELEPRDVVSRAVWAQLAAGHRVFLDARTALGETFARRFPGIAAACRAAGIDPATQPVPVRPAAHYHMGGVAVDAAGRSSVEGLWACGEVARTGLHGANRLASNSLLEAAICGRAVGHDVGGQAEGAPLPLPPVALPVAPDPAVVRPILSEHLGVLREATGLKAAITALLPLAEAGGAAADPATVGLLLAVAALRRQENRGGHARTDFPGHEPGPARSHTLILDEALNLARALPARWPAARSA